VSLIQQRAALLQWYRQDFAVGSQPYAIAFDGANVWVTNSGGNKVTKLRAGDGSNLGTFTVGNAPTRIAFDGANVYGFSVTAYIAFGCSRRRWLHSSRAQNVAFFADWIVFSDRCGRHD
jgi:hypothetical protein